MVRNRFFIPLAAGVLGAVLALIAPATPAYAQSLDPFESDTGQWKSFDRYKEEEKEHLFSTMTGNPDIDSRTEAEKAAEEEKAARDAADAQREAALQTAVQNADGKNDGPPITMPSMNADGTAAPARPLAIPVMPGKEEDGTNPAAQEDEAKPVARVVNMELQPNLQLQKQDWLDAMQAAREEAEGKDASDDNTPLHVRMSFLPGIEFPKKKLQQMAVAKPVVLPRPPAPKSAADVAACAAIDAYKKRQLEAIQSDRETLAALQTAIKQLGLEQKLDFMTGADAKSSANGSGAVLMDMPSSTMSALPPVAKP